MASITIKNIPDDLHNELKQLAKRGGRSLNQEILQRLRAAVAAAPRQQDIEKRLAAVNRLHTEMLASGYQPPSAEEIVRIVRAGRDSR